MANLRTGASNPELVFKVTKDHFDTLTKGANLLLVANGAGLAGCVAFFKEPNPPALYGGRLASIGCFGSEYLDPPFAGQTARAASSSSIVHRPSSIVDPELHFVSTASVFVYYPYLKKARCEQQIGAGSQRQQVSFGARPR